MLQIEIGRRAEKYLRTLPKKHARQVALKIHSLRTNPEPSDSRKLTNSDFRRADIGEHRIIYTCTKTVLSIPLIGKRNDDEVYRRLDRLQRS